MDRMNTIYKKFIAQISKHRKHIIGSIAFLNFFLSWKKKDKRGKK
jgi:hypothetical protein